MTALAHQPHPVTRAVAGVRDQLTSVTEVPVWSMDAAETTDAIGEVQAAEAQLAELKARLLSHATRIDLPGDTAKSSTANWHAVTTRTTRPAAHRAVRLADGLEQHDLTRTALAEGRVHVEQAHVILHALAELPADLDQACRAGRAAPARAGRRVRRQSPQDPGPPDPRPHRPRRRRRPRSRAAWRSEERDAQAATRLVIYDDGHGKTHGRFTLATFDRRRPQEGPTGDRRP